MRVGRAGGGQRADAREDRLIHRWIEARTTKGRRSNATSAAGEPREAGERTPGGDATRGEGGAARGAPRARGKRRRAATEGGDSSALRARQFEKSRRGWMCARWRDLGRRAGRGADEPFGVDASFFTFTARGTSSSLSSSSIWGAMAAGARPELPRGRAPPARVSDHPAFSASAKSRVDLLSK